VDIINNINQIYLGSGSDIIYLWGNINQANRIDGACNYVTYKFLKAGIDKVIFGHLTSEIYLEDSHLSY
jgi:hypothetical protein